MPTMTTTAFDDLSAERLVACCQVWVETWPDHGDLDPVVRAADIRERCQTAEPALNDHLIHILSDGEAVLAVSRTFRHSVNVAGQAQPVVALASVATRPDQRGHGYGAAVVRQAFAGMRGDEVALYQTKVPDFYRKLGARELVDAVVVNRRDDRQAFWDPHTIIFPASYRWPAGEIDLNGPGW